MDMCGRALSCYMYVSGGVNYQNFVLYEIELRKVSLPWWTVKDLKVDFASLPLAVSPQNVFWKDCRTGLSSRAGSGDFPRLI